MSTSTPAVRPTAQPPARATKSGMVPVSEDTALAIQQANEAAMAAFGSGSSGNIIAALQVAESMESLQRLFDDPAIRSRILALQDKAIGFRTDRDPKQKRRGTQECNTPYSYDVVKDCAIEAGLRGLQLVGNQWNIISGRTYCTKEGFEFLIRGLKHVTDFKVNLGVPANKPGGVIIECEGSWNNSGQPQSLKSSIPVKSDDYSSADQLLGKATRKFLKRCYEQMTGNIMPEGEAGEEGQIEAAQGRVLIPHKAPKFIAPDPTPAPTQQPAPADQESQSDPSGEPAGPSELDEKRMTIRDAFEAAGMQFEHLKAFLAARGLDLGADETDFLKLSQGVCDRLTRSSDSLKSFVAQAKKLAGGVK